MMDWHEVVADECHQGWEASLLATRMSKQSPISARPRISTRHLVKDLSSHLEDHVKWSRHCIYVQAGGIPPSIPRTFARAPHMSLRLYLVMNDKDKDKDEDDDDEEEKRKKRRRKRRRSKRRRKISSNLILLKLWRVRSVSQSSHIRRDQILGWLSPKRERRAIHRSS